jgi:predicted helicase
MIAPEIERLRSIKDFPTLVAYLRDELEWPIDEGIAEEDMVFDYAPEEVGLDPASAVKIERIVRLRPLVSGQPWGIFYIEFKPGKLPITVLRRILRALVIKKRESARDRQAWQLGDLMFLSTLGETESRHINLAHFSEDGDGSGRAVLRVVDWDEQDTHFHVLRNVEELQRLRWPADPTDVDRWRKTWSSAFALKLGEVAKTSKQLAVEMARLARVIRSRVSAAMTIESPKGPLRRLYKAFQEVLLHDLKEDDFADMYAQSITYGLFAARRSRPAGITVENARDIVPETNPFLRDLLAEFTEVGGITKTLDFDELGIDALVGMLNRANMEAIVADVGDKTRVEDPVIYFYELFLNEYDAKKKVQRGVFFTPPQVVSFIVRSVDEILRTEFGLADGLADTTTWGEMQKRHPELKLPAGAKPDTPFVQILDPAVGTGTFLVEAIDIIHRTMMEKWESQGHLPMLDIPQMWNDYVTNHLLPRLYGFELMMAPYAIAHMKVGLKLEETGYRFSSHERLRIYLTNTLEPPQDFSDQFELLAPALAHEAEAVNKIKRQQRFTVVIGNPPYAIMSANLSKESRQLVDRFRYVDGTKISEKSAIVFERTLQDDYVKFHAFAGARLGESHAGVLGYISNNSYLENINLRGMRSELLDSYERISLLDLHGDADRREVTESGEKDENIFDIKQGVAVFLARRLPTSHTGKAEVERSDLLGTRSSKYETLTRSTIRRLGATTLSPRPDRYVFAAVNAEITEEFESGCSLAALFLQRATGIETGKDSILVDFDEDGLGHRMRHFGDPALADERIRMEYDAERGCGRTIADRRATILSDPQFDERFKILTFAPFDNRVVFYRTDLVNVHSYQVARHLFATRNIALLAMRQVVLGKQFTHVFVTRGIANNRAFYSTRGKVYMFPLALCPPENMLSFSQGSLSSNLDKKLARSLAASPGSIPRSAEPQDELFAFIYAQLHSQSYRDRYDAPLRMDYPHVFRARSGDLYARLCQLGAELVALHLMESPKLDEHITTLAGSGDFQVEKVSHSDETVWLDTAKTRGFRGVPEEVWNFHIGGYQVCDKWLKDRRGRVLSDYDISHYQRIVVALNETIRLMGEIDEVIEAHGGWTDAFQSVAGDPTP